MVLRLMRKEEVMKKLSALFIFVLLIFLSGCGPIVREYVTQDNSYNFDPNDKTVLLSIVNNDTWILQGNEIFEKKLHSLATALLREHGFTLTNIKNKSHYLFLLTVGSEIKRQPVRSYTTTETKRVYPSGDLVDVPKTHVTGGGSYRTVIVSGSCFDGKTGKQVFYERTSTTMLNLAKLRGYTAEDMYKKPVSKIMQSFLRNFIE